MESNYLNGGENKQKPGSVIRQTWHQYREKCVSLIGTMDRDDDKEFEKEQELERDKEKFLDEYKEVYLLVKILFKIFEKESSQKTGRL